MASKELELVQQLVEKSRAKAITWEPTATNNEFVAAFKGNVTFTISKFEDPNYYGDSYRLVMRDESNREMLTVDRGFNALSSEQPPLADLYQAAHDSALNVEETIDSILNDLRKVS